VRSSESSVVRPITKSSGIAFALVLLAAVFVVSVRELRRPKVQLVEALGFFLRNPLHLPALLRSRITRVLFL
jgi:hypothetical protein